QLGADLLRLELVVVGNDDKISHGNILLSVFASGRANSRLPMISVLTKFPVMHASENIDENLPRTSSGGTRFECQGFASKFVIRGCNEGSPSTPHTPQPRTGHATAHQRCAQGRRDHGRDDGGSETLRRSGADPCRGCFSDGGPIMTDQMLIVFSVLAG